MERLPCLIVAAAGCLLLLMSGEANAQKAQPKPSALSKSSSKTASKTDRTSAKKSASPCKGLLKTVCVRSTSCGWIEPKKKVDKRGRKLSAYCRKVSTGARPASKAKVKTSAASKKK